MPARGRPPLTEDAVAERIAAYCARYGVSVNANGLPPFPAGQRETPQHREWIAVLNARRRLQRRGEATAAPRAIPGTCPVCENPLHSDVVEHRSRGGSAWPLHPACRDVVVLVEAAGPDVLDRLRALLWPRNR